LDIDYYGIAMNDDIEKKHYESSLRWQKITTFCTLVLALAAILALTITICYNNKLIKESIESRVAENRPSIDMRVRPLSQDGQGGMLLEIKNVGKGPAYNINYSYHYYDFFTKRVIFEYGTSISGEDYFTVLESGEILNRFTEEDRKRFNIRKEDGLPRIYSGMRLDDIEKTFDSSFVACAVYVEYEDFKGNVFWSARQFGIKIGGIYKILPIRLPHAPFHTEVGKAEGTFVARARERAVKGIEDFEGLKMLDRADLIQTEKLEDTLWKKSLK
jgi:hypothetical protein